MGGLAQDLRYAIRQLRKSPGFTTVAVLTLALGIGANTAIFNVIETVVFRRLPFDQPDRLVWLNGKFPQTDEAGVSVPDFVDYRAGNRSFERIAAMSQDVMAGPANLSGDKPERVLSGLVSANFFETLGVHPLLGRDFQSGDEQVKTAQVAILGYGIWRRDFAGDRGIIGRAIRLDGETFTVVGVLPKDVPLLSEAQVWRPMPLLSPFMHMRMAHFLGVVVGRLKSGTSVSQAQADLDGIAASLARQYPDTNKGWSLRQRPLSEVLIGPVRPALMMIWAAAGLLLLIACTNLANLCLTRSIARQKEFAVRTALGATRGRMLRQSLTESITLALGGGASGVVAASWGVHLLRIVGPTNLPRLQEVHINPAVLGFALGVSLLSGAVSGLVPALQACSHGFGEGLKESARTSAPAAHKHLRSALVIGEIGISLALLTGAGLLLKSFWLLVHVNPGFQSEHVLTAQLSLNGRAYTEAHRIRFWQEFEQRIANLPGVEAVGGTSELPLSGQHSDNPFRIPGRTYGPSEFDDAFFRQVTPGYLAAMRIPLIAGRWLDWSDSAASPGTILVNEAFARRFFPGENVLGKRLLMMGDMKPEREIVGLVGNIRHTSLSDPQQPEMYVAYAQYANPTMNLVVRAAASPGTLASALREIVGVINKEEILSPVRSLDDIVESSVAQPRFSSLLLGSFAGLALMLAAVGLYGVMAYSVTQRTNEIGIRMALGAKQTDMLTMIVTQGMKLVLTGIAMGIGGSLAFGRLLADMLYSVKPADPLVLGLVSCGLIAVALCANYVPARRAAKVDPMVALRYE